MVDILLGGCETWWEVRLEWETNIWEEWQWVGPRVLLLRSEWSVGIVGVKIELVRATWCMLELWRTSLFQKTGHCRYT